MKTFHAFPLNPIDALASQVIIAGADGIAVASALKTINGQSLLGSGNISIIVDLTGYATTQYVDDEITANGASLQAFASNASNLASGTVSDNRLSANVARLDRANTFAALQTISISTTTGTLLTVGTASNANAFGVIQYSAGGGARYVWARGEGFYAQSDAGVNQAAVSQYGIRVASGVAFQFSSSTTNTSSIDCSILRNATGPTLETRAAGGLKVCNADGSALGWLQAGLVSCGTYTVGTLPSASANAGRLAQVTDSSVTTNGSAVSGGGSNRVLVYSNGTSWDVVVA